MSTVAGHNSGTGKKGIRVYKIVVLGDGGVGKSGGWYSGLTVCCCRVFGMCLYAWGGRGGRGTCV